MSVSHCTARPPAAPSGPVARRPAPPAAPRRLPSAELFGHGDQLIIEHGGRDYRLRITRNGRLLLTA